jgi:hypothetical protein
MFSSSALPLPARSRIGNASSNPWVERTFPRTALGAGTVTLPLAGY